MPSRDESTEIVLFVSGTGDDLAASYAMMLPFGVAALKLAYIQQFFTPSAPHVCL